MQRLEVSGLKKPSLDDMPAVRDRAPPGLVLRGRFELFAELGKGSFSHVFFGTDLITAQSVAIKLENRSQKFSLLEWESEVLRNLNRQKVAGVPRLVWYGTHDDFDVMVMEKGGANLAMCMDSQRDRRMAPRLVARLGVRMLDILQSLHRVGYVHRDIKPENFILRRMVHPSLFRGDDDGVDHDLMLIDFGLATSFRDPVGQHVAMRKSNRFVGTLAFASLLTSQGYRHSRRDDLESMVHCLIFLIRGSLPWQGCDPYGRMDSAEYYEKVLKLKLQTSIAQLCHDLPRQFETVLSYIRELAFEETPSYRYLRSLILSMA